MEKIAGSAFVITDLPWIRISSLRVTIIETSDGLCWQIWRSSTGSGVRTLCHDEKGMKMRDNFYRTLLGLKLNDCRIEDRARVTHPGTEQRPVCGRLVLRMVPSMFSGLGLS